MSVSRRKGGGKANDKYLDVFRPRTGTSCTANAPREFTVKWLTETDGYRKNSQNSHVFFLSPPCSKRTTAYFPVQLWNSTQQCMLL